MESFFLNTIQTDQNKMESIVFHQFLTDGYFFHIPHTSIQLPDMFENPIKNQINRINNIDNPKIKNYFMN